MYPLKPQDNGTIKGRAMYPLKPQDNGTIKGRAMYPLKPRDDATGQEIGPVFGRHKVWGPASPSVGHFS